jgi:putative transposase
MILLHLLTENMTVNQAETINGLYKTEVNRRRGPWKNNEEVEYATMEWVGWLNNRRQLEPLGIYR